MMHTDQIPIDTNTLQRLLTAQFPHWADLPIVPFASSGTENALFRLGDHLAARLPLRPNKAQQVHKEHRWLPHFAPHLPLPISEPVGLGQPSNTYPSPWSVCRWLPGVHPTMDTLAHPARAAQQLAAFLLALQKIDPTDGPSPGEHNFWRGIPLAQRDTLTQDALARSEHLLDTKAIARAWAIDRDAPTWTHRPVWIHGDLTPGNLLMTEGRLSGVIDWGGLGVGDPATDLLPAWNLFSGPSRAAFRAAMGVDDATWARGRGLALSVAVVALPYYLHTNPTMVAGARHVIAAVLADMDSSAP
ncbi:MAG: aminoglycoside phosphotransferase family protein [Myxococcota bacterium]